MSIERSDNALVGMHKLQDKVYQLITISPAENVSSEVLLSLKDKYIELSGSLPLAVQIEQANRLHIHIVVEKGYKNSNKYLMKAIHKMCGKPKVKHEICCNIREDKDPTLFIKYVNKGIKGSEGDPHKTTT